VEMNEKLEEKDKSLRDELIKERDRINNEIQMRQAKEAQLETEIASLHMAQEDAETESKRKILSSLEETMEDELKCSICTELLIEATNLNCSHSFCAYCIQEWKKTKNECPVCRTRITSEERVLALDSYIDKMVVHLSDDMKQRREENRKFREEQKQGMHRPQPSTIHGDDSDDSDDEDDDHIDNVDFLQMLLALAHGRRQQTEQDVTRFMAVNNDGSNDNDADDEGDDDEDIVEDYDEDEDEDNDEVFEVEVEVEDESNYDPIENGLDEEDSDDDNGGKTYHSDHDESASGHGDENEDSDSDSSAMLFDSDSEEEEE